MTYIDLGQTLVYLGWSVTPEPRGQDTGRAVPTGLGARSGLSKSDFICWFVHAWICFLQLHVIDSAKD